MHLAIISSIIAFLIRRPLGLKAAALLGAVFVVLYTVLVGAQPSLVRAAIMYIIGVFAVLGVIKKDPLKLLALSFAVQLFFNSASGQSISFILSYLALAGILTIGTESALLLKGFLPRFIAEPLAASSGAFLATIQVTVGFFGVLNFSGIVTGLVMVPLTTLFMGFSLAYLALSFVPFVNFVFEYPLSFLYLVLSKCAAAGARIPSFKIKNTGLFMACSFVFVLIILFLICRSLEKRRVLSDFKNC